MLDAAVSGLLSLFTPQSLTFMGLGVAFGILIGVLPGLGGLVAMALLLPFIPGVEPTAAIALLLGAHVATIYNSSVSGILFNIPGSTKGVPLCFDGYPMTQQGQGGRALGATAVASLIGGVVGVAVLIALLPGIRAIMLALGPPEYFAMGILALTVIAIFSAGTVFKGLMSAGLGLTLSFIGQDPTTALPRFTFGSLYLQNGIDLAVAAIGLFAVSQMINLYVQGGKIVHTSPDLRQSSVWKGARDVFRHPRVVLQSATLGVFIGSMPGIGAETGGIAAYGQAAQTSRRRDRRFGEGRVEGVIAPGSTLGANEGGALIPTLGFGIPGGESMAILLSAFLVLGVSPGVEMLTSELDLVFSMVWTIVIANLAVTGVGLFTARFLARIADIRTEILIPLVLAICMVGAYAVNQRIEDVVLVVVLGIIGYVLKKYRYSLANVLIGLVLGSILERYLQISITLHGGVSWLARPVTVALLCLVAASILWPAFRNSKLKASDHETVQR